MVAARRREALEELAQDIREKACGACCVLEYDASDSTLANAKHLVDATVQHFGHLDAVVSNVGVNALWDFDSWLGRSAAALDDVMKVNFSSHEALARASLPELIASKGYFAVVSSESGSLVSPGMAAYAASKAALTIFFISWYEDLARRGVGVTVVCPGPIGTGAMRQWIDCAGNAQLKDLRARVNDPGVRSATEIAEQTLLAMLDRDPLVYIEPRHLLLCALQPLAPLLTMWIKRFQPVLSWLEVALRMK